MSNSFNVAKSFEVYKACVKIKAEDLITEEFPRRIEELSKLIDSKEFNYEHQKNRLIEAIIIPASDSVQQTIANPEDDDCGERPPKIRKLDDDDAVGNNLEDESSTTDILLATAVPCNAVVKSRAEILERYIREFIGHTNLLIMSIRLLIPKVEDGNNTGVAIQESILKFILSIETQATGFFAANMRYHSNRASYVSKVIKNPHLEDYRLALIEQDKKEFFKLLQDLYITRNNYATLYDLIGKNWAKITEPRSSNAENMY